MKSYKVLKEFAMGGKVQPVGSMFRCLDNGSTAAGIRFRQLEVVPEKVLEEHARDPRKVAELLVANQAGKLQRPLTAGEVFDLATGKGLAEGVEEALLDIAQALGEKQTGGDAKRAAKKAQEEAARLKAKADREAKEAAALAEQQAKELAAKQEADRVAALGAAQPQQPAQQS